MKVFPSFTQNFTFLQKIAHFKNRYYYLNTLHSNNNITKIKRDINNRRTCGNRGCYAERTTVNHISLNVFVGAQLQMFGYFLNIHRITYTILQIHLQNCVKSHIYKNLQRTIAKKIMF